MAEAHLKFCGWSARHVTVGFQEQFSAIGSGVVEVREEDGV